MSDHLDEGVLQRELNEKNVIEMIDEVTSKWPLLGLHLNVPKHKLDEFLLTHPHNLTQIKLSLISHWIRNDLEPSWRKLADALDRAEHRRLGEKIRKKYSIRPYSGGRAPTSPRSQTPSPLAVFHTRINPFSFPSPPPPPSVIVRQPSTSPYNNIVENKSYLQEKGIGMTILQCVFCDCIKSVKTVDMAKDKKKRYVEKLQESPAPDKMLHYLLHGVLDPFYVGEGGRTILHFAAIHCSLESLKTLIAFRGPDLSPLSNEGTPIEMTGVNIHGGEEIRTLLESVGARKYSELVLRQNTFRLPRSEGLRMLAMDGPGLSAILHIETLQQLERESERKMFEIFDCITATGLSGLFILLMVYGHQSLADVRRLYFKLRHEVFHHRSSSSSRTYEAFLKSYLAPEIKMNSRQNPKIILPVVHQTKSGVQQTVFFNNCTKNDLSEVPVWKVAHYLCTAPPNIPVLDGYLSQQQDDRGALLDEGILRASQLCGSGDGHRGDGHRGGEAKITRLLRLRRGQYPQFSTPITTEVGDRSCPNCMAFNPHLTCSLSSSYSSSYSSYSSSLSPNDSQLVDCIIATMQQVSQNVGKLVKFLS